MTEYFDTIYSKLSSARSSTSLGLTAERFDEVDEQVVRDVSVCSEFPGFPEDLRDRINAIVLEHSTACLPLNAERTQHDTPAQHFESLSSLISKLHDVFHELAERRIRGFSDDPRIPVRILYTRAEQRREDIIEQKRERARVATEES